MSTLCNITLGIRFELACPHSFSCSEGMYDISVNVKGHSELLGSLADFLQEEKMEVAKVKTFVNTDQDYSGR